MKYFIIAGEASGDLHGANLIHALKKEDSEASFSFWGGDKMEAACDTKPLKHFKELAFMGFWEVLVNIRKIFKNLKACKAQILESNPDVVILIDYPGFNLKIAKFAHTKGLKVFYYISPKIWAWKQKRVYTIKENVNKMFSILPFEVAFYNKFNVDVDYIGNPLMDEIERFKSSPIQSPISDERIIALLPGSRVQELTRILPYMLEMVDRFTDYKFKIAATHNLPSSLYTELIKDSNVELVYDKTYELLQQSEAALVTSGTATLETALLNIPQVVCYKASPISYSIAKRLVKIRFASLVNLIMDREVVRELIQHDLNEMNLEQELKAILPEGEKRKLIFSDYNTMQKLVGDAGASMRAAKLMVKYLSEK